MIANITTALAEVTSKLSINIQIVNAFRYTVSVKLFSCAVVV